MRGASGIRSASDGLRGALAAYGLKSGVWMGFDERATTCNEIGR